MPKYFINEGSWCFSSRLIFAGYKGIGGYAGSMTFKEAIAEERGELLFEEL